MIFDVVRDRLNDGLDGLRGYADKLFVEAGAARDLLSEVSTYAIACVRERYLGQTVEPSIMLLNRVIIQAANALIEAKKDAAVAIADEKRLVKQAEQEDAAAKEWEQRARMASEAGDDALAKEALARKQAHAAFASELCARWQEQRALVEELKGTLRRFNHAIDRTKLARNRMIARQHGARTHRLLEEHVAQMDHFVEMLDLLMEIEGTRQRGGPGQRGSSVP